MYLLVQTTILRRPLNMICNLGAEELKIDEEDPNAEVRGVAPTEVDTPAPASKSQSNENIHLFAES